MAGMLSNGSAADLDDARAIGREIIGRALSEGSDSLEESAGKALLTAYGIDTPLGTVVRSAADAVRALEALGGPVVLKGMGPDIQHKSDLGLVALDVRDAHAARAAYHRIIDRGAGRVQGVLVEGLVPHERELLVGMRRDEQFGTVLAFGLGGIFTEALRDVAFALAPVDAADAEDLIDGLGAQRLLGPVRGLPRVDRQSLVRVIRAVGQMAADHPEIREIDVNPLLVSGTRLVAADALVVLRAGEGSGANAGRGTERAPDLAWEAAAEAGGPEVHPGGGHGSRAEGLRPDLDAVFAPGSVAVVGASEDITKWGGSLLRNLIDGGYRGEVHPVNPRGGTIFGLPAATGIPELAAATAAGGERRPIDLAVVAVGAAHAERVVRQCGEAGTRAAMVIAAGFAEAGAGGAALEAALARAAGDHGMTLIGPNCMGALANSARLNAVGFVELRPEAGPLSVVSQSGNIGTQLLMAAERRGIGVEKYLSTGNQACTSATDVLEHLAADPHTGVIVMYIEGLDEGRRFYETARAASGRKPVVVIHGGTSAYGRRAASSHTGALAGSAEVFAAAARQAGVLVATDPDESLDVAACLAFLPRPGGRRVAVVTLGGGWGVLTADALAAAGLQLADLPAEVLAAADALLPPFWSHGNPVDLVATVLDGVPERVIELVAGCAEVDAVLALALVGSPSSGRSVSTDEDAATEGELNEEEKAFLGRVAAVMERTGKPVITVPLCPVKRSVFAGLGTYAPVLLPTPSAAVRALAGMTRYARFRDRRD